MGAGSHQLALGGAYFGGLQQRMITALAEFGDDDVGVAKKIVESLIQAINQSAE
jgi:hypothetical protein